MTGLVTAVQDSHGVGAQSEQDGCGCSCDDTQPRCTQGLCFQEVGAFAVQGRAQ
jgi:hypothetical protein